MFTFSVVPLPPGGDLHYHLSQHGVFSETEMRFYATEIILGLEHMHTRFVVYRDLKVRARRAPRDGAAREGRGRTLASRHTLSFSLPQPPRTCHLCEVGFSKLCSRGSRLSQGLLSPRCLRPCLGHSSYAHSKFVSG